MIRAFLSRLASRSRGYQYEVLDVSSVRTEVLLRLLVLAFVGVFLVPGDTTQAQTPPYAVCAQNEHGYTLWMDNQPLATGEVLVLRLSRRAGVCDVQIARQSVQMRDAQPLPENLARCVIANERAYLVASFIPADGTVQLSIASHNAGCEMLERGVTYRQWHPFVAQ